MLVEGACASASEARTDQRGEAKSYEGFLEQAPFLHALDSGCPNDGTNRPESVARSTKARASCLASDAASAEIPDRL